MLGSGTQCILDGDNRLAQLDASFAFYFEDIIAVEVDRSKALANFSKIIELDEADNHTLVSYYRNRIPCSCLDETFKRVKSVKKMGWCYNPTYNPTCISRAQ